MFFESMLSDLLFWFKSNFVELTLLMIMFIKVDLIKIRLKNIEKHLGIKTKLVFWNKKTKKDE